jgi:uncharacterized LabA/DUF88 family protein
MHQRLGHLFGTHAMNAKFALLLDGGFVTKALSARNKARATAQDVLAECSRICSHSDFSGMDLLRIYFYDAPPATGIETNPLDGSQIDLGKTPIHAHYSRLIDTLESSPNFAVRRGETVVRGWKIGQQASIKLVKGKTLTATDLVPNIQQKGVDLRLGLDIARIALRQTAQTIVVVAGDSDLIPAFKFARREGVRVYLDHLGLNVRRELRVHADIVL